MRDEQDGWGWEHWLRFLVVSVVVFFTLAGGMWLGQRKVNYQVEQRAYVKGYWDGVSYTEAQWLARQD